MVEKKAQNLVHGEFGSKFATALTNPWLDTPTVINGTPGSRLELIAESGVDSYAYAQNETSTGVVTPVKRVAGADANAIFFTDATSAAVACVVIDNNAAVNDDELVWPTLGTASKATARNQLAARGIVCR